MIRSIHDKPIDDIQESDLQALVSSGVPEARKIEYKLSLPGTTDSEKKEFLADVSSFANTSGGVLLYGVREENGAAVELVGIPSQNLDQEKLRLESIIRDGINPRLPVLIQPIPLANGRIVLLIRVSKSYAAPHMVSFKGSSRFYARSSAGKYQLDFSQLRAAFSASESFGTKARDFRIDRVSKILASDTPVQLRDPPIAVLHLLPMSAFDLSRLDVSSLAGQSDTLRPLMTYGSYSAPRYNFDGLISHNTSQGAAESYVQLFAAGGVIEAVLADLDERVDANRKFFPITWLEDRLIEELPRYLQAQASLGVDEPIFMLLSLLGVRGFMMHVENRHRVDQTAIDRDTMLIPEVLIEDRRIRSEALLRPIFDVIWNAAGWTRSMNYDKDGNRIRRR
ncbi:MAG TPA: ATP-binding protein [Pyrinomonadaceae bacterium]|nr:ATP-binding protein [Pyrinomonadaceae bacterium]